MTSHADGRAGFTLIELLVALIIAGLLLVMLPRPLARIGATQLESAVQSVAADLRRARSRAVLTAARQRFVLDLDQRRFGVEGLGANTLPAGIDVAFIGATQERLAERRVAIRFFPDGSSTGGRVYLADQAAKVEIRVDWLTGRVTVRHG